MAWLLDTDFCSIHLRRPRGLMHRFVQYSGNLSISTISLAELYVWAFRRPNPTRLQQSIEQDLLAAVQVLDFVAGCARKFGETRAEMLNQGQVVQTTDLLIASVALAHDLTLVTHNTSHFAAIPQLRLADWTEA
jgi:tRNA(fMet)-specific endonuclease VapC